MPFGKLTGTKIVKQKETKQESVPDIEPEAAPEPIFEPEPEPVPEPVFEPEPEPVPEPASVYPDPVYIADLHIVMAGRTLGIQREYLASMKENLSQMLSAEGLSFYIRDLQTITDLVDVSKRLRDFFFRFSKEDWSYPADEASETYYEFSISPAGRQTGAVHFGIHCVTSGIFRADLIRQADAVWCIADGAMWDETDAQDGYLNELRGILSAASSSAGKSVPVVLIQAQTEAWMHFRKQGTKQTLKISDRQRLDVRCGELLGSSVNPAHPVAMIPVQLYDGLEYAGKDARGIPFLRLSEDGYHQMYTPVNCQMPVLYTVQTIAQRRGIRLFEETVRGGFPAAVQRHYELKTGKKDYRPSFLPDDAAAEGGV